MVMGEVKRLISVIIPVYNVETYLGECLRSLCSQTYKNLEIILIDDGSKDNSGIICDQWSEKDKRIHVIHQDNCGVSIARNVGLSVCKGDLISFVDADDWLDEAMYEKLLHSYVSNNADVVMCGFVDYPHGYPVKKGLYSVPPCDYTNAVYQMIRRNGYFTSLWAKLFSRECVFKDGSAYEFDSVLSFGEDEVWLFRILRNCSRVAFLPEALYYWRAREGSISRPERITDKQMSILSAKKESLSILPDENSLQRLARGRFYNDCISLKVLAYCTSNIDALQTIRKTLRPMWWDWLVSKEIVFLRKCKVLLLDIEMLCRFPISIIKRTNSMTHKKLSQKDGRHY